MLSRNVIYKHVRNIETNRIPLDHTALLSFVSTRTSDVLICFSANFLMALMALGARFLNPLRRGGREGWNVERGEGGTWRQKVVSRQGRRKEGRSIKRREMREIIPRKHNFCHLCCM